MRPAVAPTCHRLVTLSPWLFLIESRPRVPPSKDWDKMCMRTCICWTIRERQGGCVQVGWTPALFPCLVGIRPDDTWTVYSSSLTSKRLASLSRNLRTAWLVCSCRRFLNGSRACSCLLPHRSVSCVNLSASVCVCVLSVVSVSRGCLHGSRSLPRGALLLGHASQAVCHLVSSSGFLLDNCASSSAPFGLWHPWICGGPLCLHVPQGGVFLAPLVPCVFPCLHGLLWFCVVCRVPPSVL